MKRLITAALLFLLAGCGPITSPPVGNKAWDFSVSVSDPSGHLIPSAQVSITDMGVAKATNDFGWAYFLIKEDCHVFKVEKEGFKPTGDLNICIFDHTRVAIKLEYLAPPVSRLTTNGKIFNQEGKPWRWMGVTAFGLQNRYCKGDDINPFLEAFKGFNVLRVFYYVEWEGTGWGAPSDECMHGFLNYVGQRGFYVEMVLLTGPKPVSEAQQLVNHIFTDFGAHTNLMIELVNEPGIHDKVDPSDLTIPSTPVIWTDGYTNEKHRGLYLTPHTPRDNEWPRKAHDLLEYWTGGGPGSPSDPAWKQPAVADEPMRPDEAGYVATDYEAYFGTSAILGAGATFHFESGKYGNPPTPQEAACALASLKGLTYFPPDAPLGPYSRIDENGATLRTYQVGPYMVRIRPTSGAILIRPE